MEKLKEGNYYHIYNRGINGADLFLEDEHFQFFLRKYSFYTHLTVKTYAYCLMKNHFHFQIKARTGKEQKQFFHSYQQNLKSNKKEWMPHGCKYKNYKKQSTSRQLAHLFNKYTKNFNSWNSRTGKLFEQAFKRNRVEDKEYLTYLTCYIHRNPIHHGISDDFRTYPHSSYKTHLAGSATLLERDEVLSWFGSKKYYISAHKETKLKITPE